MIWFIFFLLSVIIIAIYITISTFRLHVKSNRITEMKIKILQSRIEENIRQLK